MNRVLRISDTSVVVVFGDDPKMLSLIAAASELLAACQAVISAANRNLESENPHGQDAIEISKKALGQVIDAVLKAVKT